MNELINQRTNEYLFVFLSVCSFVSRSFRLPVCLTVSLNLVYLHPLSPCQTPIKWHTGCYGNAGNAPPLSSLPPSYLLFPIYPRLPPSFLPAFTLFLLLCPVSSDSAMAYSLRHRTLDGSNFGKIKRYIDSDIRCH